MTFIFFNNTCVTRLSCIPQFISINTSQDLLWDLFSFLSLHCDVSGECRGYLTTVIQNFIKQIYHIRRKLKSEVRSQSRKIIADKPQVQKQRFWEFIHSINTKLQMDFLNLFIAVIPSYRWRKTCSKYDLSHDSDEYNFKKQN